LVQPHVHIAPIVQSIQFSHERGEKEPLLALLMPMYHISLAELLSGFHNLSVPVPLFNQIALGLLAAGARFQEKNLSQCDIKPDNIMMEGSNPVLVDFGAVVMIGEAIREHTPFYSLDANKIAVTPEFDLCCIVTTLVRCVFPLFELQYRTRIQMISLINQIEPLWNYLHWTSRSPFISTS
jgi:serine/threonine protein kinase